MTPRSAAFPRRKHERLVFLLVPGLAALLVITLFSLAASNLSTARENRLLESERAARNLTHAFEARASRSLQAVDDSLSAIVQAWRRQPELRRADTPRRALIAESSSALPDVRSLVITDRAGVPLVQSRPLPPGMTKLSLGLRASRAGAQAEGDPMVSAAGGMLVIARRLTDPSGHFDGVVAAVLDAEALNQFFRPLDLGSDGAVALLHESGELIARQPPAPSWIDKAASAPLDQEKPETRSQAWNFRGMSPIDNVARIEATRTLAGFPLMVQVGLSQDTMLADWHRDKRLLLTIMMVFALAVITLAVWLARELGRRREEPVAGIGDGRLLRQVLDVLPVGVQIADRHGLPILGNAQAGRPWPIIKRPQSNHGENQTSQITQADADNSAGQEVFDFETASGDRKTLLGTRTSVFNADHEMVGDISVFEEVSEQRALQASLRESESRFQALVQNNFDVVLITHGDDAIAFANREAQTLLGYSEKELAALGFQMLTDGAGPQLTTLLEQRRQAGSARGELQLRHRNGSVFPAEVSSAVFHDRNGLACAIMILRDLTSERRAEEHIEYLAYHDELTGIPNRAYFQRAAEQMLAAGQEPDSGCSLLLIDLDRFKHVNEIIGHGAGDQLLKEVAARLRTCLREGDILARLGGDEFVILMQNADNLEAVSTVARKILEVTSRPLVIDEHEFLVTASIGISSSPRDGTDLRTLLRNSDMAMYRAKDAGRNAFRYFSSAMEPEGRNRLTTEFALRGALERREFAVHFQPKVNLTSRIVAGMEALVRWHNPEKGLMQPGEFIAIAEETGMIGPIGDWVLREACIQGRNLRDAGHLPLKVSVNLSARQLFDQGFAQRVADTLDETGFPAECLELEITESMIMRDTPNSILVLEALRATGVRIAIDDFGTGYSSLAYLKQFPIDCVKIDRSFIRDLPEDRDDASITRGIIAMAHNMKLEVVAEGVETVAQLEFLRIHGCDEIQGFLFSEPLVMRDFERYLSVTPAATVH